jgi:hypothetical protein
MVTKTKGHIPLALVKRLGLTDAELTGIQTPMGEAVPKGQAIMPPGSFVAVVVF